MWEDDMPSLKEGARPGVEERDSEQGSPESGNKKVEQKTGLSQQNTPEMPLIAEGPLIVTSRFVCHLRSTHQVLRPNGNPPSLG